MSVLTEEPSDMSNTERLRDRTEDYLFRLQLIDDIPYFTAVQKAALHRREAESFAAACRDLGHRRHHPAA